MHLKYVLTVLSYYLINCTEFCFEICSQFAHTCAIGLVLKNTYDAVFSNSTNFESPKIEAQIIFSFYLFFIYLFIFW